MCIRDRVGAARHLVGVGVDQAELAVRPQADAGDRGRGRHPVSYTHLRAHETVLDLVCRLLLEKNKLTATD